MKIVLVHIKENFTPVPPVGLLYIGTILKQKGYDVWVFDINVKEQESVKKEIKAINPDIVGFGVMTTSYSIAKEFNKELKEEIPDAYYFWGGVHATALPEETMRDNNLDFLIYGEGLTLAEVCKKLEGKSKDSNKRGADLAGVDGVYYAHNGKIKKNPPRCLIKDLDSVPIPDRTLLKNFKWYLSPPGILRGKFYYGITTIYASRGCPYQCIFCASKIIHGTTIRRRSVDNVIEEIKFLISFFYFYFLYYRRFFDVLT